MARLHLWLLLLCLQTWPETARSNADVYTVNGILGESVMFPLNIQEPQQVINIVWNSKTSVAFINTAASGGTPKVTVTHQNYDNRINVSDHNYNLEIKNLSMEDAGIYHVDINVNNPDKLSTISRDYKLLIYRRLGKPKITQSLMTSVNSTCNVTLTCSVEEEDKNVTYSWSPLGMEGNIIQIFQRHEDPEHTYTCTAQNPVSNSSGSISVQQLCRDSKLSHQRRYIGLLSTGIVFSLFILIILPVMLLLLQCKRGRCSIFPKDAETKKTIYTWPAESRIYDEILEAKVEKTISQNSKPPENSTYVNVI